MTKKFVLAALSLTAVAAPASAQRLPAAVVAVVGSCTSSTGAPFGTDCSTAQTSCFNAPF